MKAKPENRIKSQQYGKIVFEHMEKWNRGEW